MVDYHLLEAFKAKYLHALDWNNGNLPIVASIGKQSKGKSYFLGKLFGEDIPNKHNEYVEKGTDILYEKVINNNFLLFDMEGLEGNQGQIERDILNFATTFVIVDVVLLHASQEDLENMVFMENFAYVMWHSTKISQKFSLELPKIIVLIRDPRISKEDQETVDFYNTLIRNFEDSVNRKIYEFEGDLIDSIKQALLNANKKQKEEEKKAIEKSIEKMKNDRITDMFKILYHFCIYSQEKFSRGRVYYEMDFDFSLRKSDFANLRNVINRIIAEKHENFVIASQFNPQDYLNIDNQASRHIHEATSYAASVENSKKTLFLNIWIEVKYNVFSHFRSIDGYLRFMEGYNRYSHKFEKINKEIASKVKKNLSGPEKISLQEQHRKEIQVDLVKCFDDPIQRAYVLPYLKYLSAVSYSETFGLNPGVTENCSYQQLSAVINFFTAENNNHVLTQTEKNKMMYECLGYYEREFREIVKIILQHKFKLFKVLFCIYKKRISDFLQVDFKYKEEVKGHFEAVYEEDYSGEVMKLISCLDLTEHFQRIRVYDFIRFLKNLEQTLVLNKLEVLENRPSRILQVENEQSYKIYSFGLYERLIPSMIGILIGIASSIIRSIIIAAAVDAAAATAAAASVAWIPIVGWVLFGLTVIGSIAWITYSAINNGKESHNINYSFYPPKGFKIIESKVIKKQLNGNYEEKVNLETQNAFEYKAIFSAKTTEPVSAFINVKIIVTYCSESCKEFIDHHKTRLNSERNNLNQSRNK